MTMANSRMLLRPLLKAATTSKLPECHLPSVYCGQQQRFGHSVRVILTKDLSDGKALAGDVLTVKAGYARNHLIPGKKALYAIPDNFQRVGIQDPDLIKETEEERKQRELLESDEDIKAANFLKYYLRNKSLKIWRMVDKDSTNASSMNAPLHPGLVDAGNVMEKLSKQLKIDLEEHEKVQIHPEPILHSLLEDEDSMKEQLDLMKSLGEGEECKVQLKTLGEYLVKIHLSGEQAIGLRLEVLKR
jgi:ribosomal protein L9